jgi:radical SAM superfamily enzyme YgiQ (UPF0313 family)
LLSEISLIRGAAIKKSVEVMQGCGVGCDFCEVTLKPLRYCEPGMIREIEVNRRATSFDDSTTIT